MNEDWCLSSPSSFSGGHHARLWDHNKPYSYLGGQDAGGMGYGAPASVAPATGSGICTISKVSDDPPTKLMARVLPKKTLCPPIVKSKLDPKMRIVSPAVTGPSGKIARSFVKTQRQIFPQTYVFAARRPDNVSVDTIQNVIVIATRDKQRLDIKEIVKRATSIDKGLFPNPIQDIGVAYFDRPLPDQDVPVLTDDYAPTDNLLHP